MSNSNFAPSELTISKLRFYSMGVVAQNKPLTTDIIEATPIEELSMVEGEITANRTDLKGKGKDANGRSFNSSVTSKVTLKCKWLPLGSSNRLTSPDVRRGESVMIYQFGDSDKYYWTTLKQDCNLRRLETVIYAFSGTTNEADSLNAENSYYLEISTHRKCVSFHTSTANGEPFSYDVQINTKEGSVTIADDAGNEFLLDSKANRLFMKNTDGSCVDVNKQAVIITAPASVQIKTKVFNVVAEESLVEGGITGSGNATFGGDLKVNNVDAGAVRGTAFNLK